MMTRMTRVSIVDQNAPHVATVDADDIAETITPWFPQAPAEVLDAIEQLQAAVLAGEYHGELAAYLGLVVQPA
jgi:hypothetical protein